MKKVSKKIVLLGSEGVGKTSLVKRYVHSIFEEEYMSTIGIKISKKEILIGDITINLLLWDVAGNMLSSKIYQNYLKGAAGAIFAFDLSRPETYKEMRQEYEAVRGKNNGIASITIGNKLDLVSKEAFSELDVDFMTSAKENNGVNEMFTALAKKMIDE